MEEEETYWFLNHRLFVGGVSEFVTINRVRRDTYRFITIFHHVVDLFRTPSIPFIGSELLIHREIRFGVAHDDFNNRGFGNNIDKHFIPQEVEQRLSRLSEV